jgi:hypothetical protein
MAGLIYMQDEIVARLANTLNAQLIAAEARRPEQTPNPDSMNLYFHAWTARSANPTLLAEIEPIFEGMRGADGGDCIGWVKRETGLDCGCPSSR